MKAILTSAAIMIALAGHANSGGLFWGTDVNAGIICVVGEVTVLAASEEDCTKIGGDATHSVQRTTTPIADEK